MNLVLPTTFLNHFGPTEGYPQGKEPLVEFLSEHIHENKKGFLFKDLSKDASVFISKDELFGERPTVGTIYKFFGFFTDSSIAGIQAQA